MQQKLLLRKGDCEPFGALFVCRGTHWRKSRWRAGWWGRWWWRRRAGSPGGPASSSPPAAGLSPGTHLGGGARENNEKKKQKNKKLFIELKGVWTNRGTNGRTIRFLLLLKQQHTVGDLVHRGGDHEEEQDDDGLPQGQLLPHARPSGLCSLGRRRLCTRVQRAYRELMVQESWT